MEKKKYLFQPDKKALKQGFSLQDDESNIVYDAKVIKQSLFGPTVFEFTNHLTEKTERHDVGKTVTVEQGNEWYMAITSSWFKLDGKKIWDHLAEMGVQIETSQTDGRLGLMYRVMINSRDAAVIETAPLGGALSFMSSGACLNVTAAEEDLDTIFLTAFSIARTDRAFE